MSPQSFLVVHIAPEPLSPGEGSRGENISREVIISLKYSILSPEELVLIDVDVLVSSFT